MGTFLAAAIAASAPFPSVFSRETVPVESNEQDLDVVFEPETLYSKAQIVAKEIAAERGQVTADDVFEKLESEGATPEQLKSLGTAVGNLFRKGFTFTGTEVRSSRPSNRGRKIRVWSLA